MPWAHLITNSPEMWLEKMPRAWVSSTHFMSNPLLLEKIDIFHTLPCLQIELNFWLLMILLFTIDANILTNNNPEKSLDAPGIFHGLWMWVRFPLKCQYFDEFPMTFTSNLTLRWQFQASLWCQSFIRIPKTMNRIFSLLVTSLTEWSLWFLQPH